jgi:hypothetical protein
VDDELHAPGFVEEALCHYGVHCRQLTQEPLGFSEILDQLVGGRVSRLEPLIPSEQRTRGGRSLAALGMR